jgi:hypothetical protein
MDRGPSLAILSRGLAVLGLGAALGCGADEAPPEAAAPAAPGPPAAEAARAGNARPVLHAVSLDPSAPVSGERVRAVVDASDPDGDPLRLGFRWRLDGQRSDAGGPAFDLPERARGLRLEVQVVATDGKLESEPAGAAAWVENQPPVIESLVIEPATEITVERELVASAFAVDPDGDPLELTYTWLVNDTPVDAPGARLAAPAFERGDRIRLQVSASDGDADSEAVLGPEIQVLNAPPRIVSSPAGFDEGGSFRYAVRVEDPDRDRSLRFRLVQAPAGMGIDWLAGTVTWTPSESQAGDHPVVIEVDDQAGGVATQAFRLQVAFEPAAKPATPPAPADTES